MKALKIPKITKSDSSKIAKPAKVGKAPAVKEPDEIEICRPVEEAVNPISGEVKPSVVIINGKQYQEVDLPDGSKTLIAA